MDKSRKKIIIISSFALLGALIAAVLIYIADGMYAPGIKPHKSIGNIWLPQALYYIASLIKPMWYAIPEWKWTAWGAPVPLWVRIIDCFPWLIWCFLLPGYILLLNNKPGGVRLLGFAFSVYFFFRVFYCINDIIKLPIIFSDPNWQHPL